MEAQEEARSAVLAKFKEGRKYDFLFSSGTTP